MINVLFIFIVVYFTAYSVYLFVLEHVITQ